MPETTTNEAAASMLASGRRALQIEAGGRSCEEEIGGGGARHRWAAAYRERPLGCRVRAPLSVRACVRVAARVRGRGERWGEWDDGGNGLGFLGG